MPTPISALSTIARPSGIGVPIVPGIMPINNFFQMARFSDMCGAEIPRWLRMKMQSYGDDAASIRSFGLDIVTELCDRLLSQGAPGLHFYTMNQAGPSFYHMAEAWALGISTVAQWQIVLVHQQTGERHRKRTCILNAGLAKLAATRFHRSGRRR